MAKIKLPDKLSAINTYKEGGLKMIHIDSMAQALRLAWLRRAGRVFSSNGGTVMIRLCSKSLRVIDEACGELVASFPIDKITFCKTYNFYKKAAVFVSSDKTENPFKAYFVSQKLETGCNFYRRGSSKSSKSGGGAYV